MTERFNKAESEELLVRCHRRCCVCHRFCGSKIEIHHIDGSDGDIGNAIPLCFECHAEVRAYDNDHPRGRKFTPRELRAHRDQWLRICTEHVGALIDSARVIEVGPIQALIDELALNERIAAVAHPGSPATFSVQQFHRAVACGAISTLAPPLREALLNVYVKLLASNHMVVSPANADYDFHIMSATKSFAIAGEVVEALRVARERLLEFLGSPPDVDS